MSQRVGRNQYWRRRKYNAKVDGSVAQTRATAYKSYAQDLHGAMATVLVEAEIKCKTEILEPAGVPTNIIPFYLDALREFCRICRKFTDKSRFNECYNTYLRWLAKGLQSNLLVLCANQCGCDLWAYYQY
jgi:hypothetical protein